MLKNIFKKAVLTGILCSSLSVPGFVEAGTVTTTTNTAATNTAIVATIVINNNNAAAAARRRAAQLSQLQARQQKANQMASILGTSEGYVLVTEQPVSSYTVVGNETATYTSVSQSAPTPYKAVPKP